MAKGLAKLKGRRAKTLRQLRQAFNPDELKIRFNTTTECFKIYMVVGNTVIDRVFEYKELKRYMSRLRNTGEF